MHSQCSSIPYFQATLEIHSQERRRGSHYAAMGPRSIKLLGFQRTMLVSVFLGRGWRSSDGACFELNLAGFRAEA